MDALKFIFDFLCFCCLIVAATIVLFLVVGLLVAVLYWSFTENPRTFAAGVGVVIFGACALRGLIRMELK